jgi:competence protein ComEC
MPHVRNSPALFLALVLLATHATTAGYATRAPDWLILVAAAIGVMAGLAGMLSFAGRHIAILTYIAWIPVTTAGFIRVHVHHHTLFGDAATAPDTRFSGEISVVQVLKDSPAWLVMKCRDRTLSAQDGAHYPDRFLLLRVYQPNGLTCLPGDVLSINGRAEAIAGPMNPKGWDMRAYYTSLGMRLAMFARPADIVVTGRRIRSFLRYPALWQRSLSQRISESISPASAQLTNALAWGDRAEMSPEIREAFAGAGAMHVLSVSGMHVAMVFSALRLVLGAPERGRPWWRGLRLALYCSAISMYVLVSGASAAAVRSGLMIMVFLGGKSLMRETPAWNFLGLAAAIQWWIDPLVADQLGFQLSFLAMAGIMLYTRPFQILIPNRTKWMQWIGSVTAMSLAAQVFLLPLLLRHFHQFPLTFILSSMVAIPAGYVVIFGAIGCLVLAAIGLPAPWLWFDKSVQLFIDSMAWLAGMNPSMHVAFPAFAMWTGLAAVVLVTLRWLYGLRSARWLALASGILCLLSLAAHRIVQWERAELVIYHTFDGFLLDIFSSGNVNTLGTIDQGRAAFASGGYRGWKDVRSIMPMEADRGPDSSWANIVVTCAGTRLLIWMGQPEIPDADFDKVLILSPGDRCTLENMLLTYTPEVILPASLKRKERLTVERVLERIPLQLHDIARMGAYTLRL